MLNANKELCLSLLEYKYSGWLYTTKTFHDRFVRVISEMDSDRDFHLF